MSTSPTPPSSWGTLDDEQLVALMRQVVAVRAGDARPAVRDAAAMIDGELRRRMRASWGAAVADRVTERLRREARIPERSSG